MKEPIETVALLRNVSSAAELLEVVQSSPFNEARCLKHALDCAAEKQKATGPWLHKITFEADARLDVLRALNRMNINRATLFPDVGGFSAFLRTGVELFDDEISPNSAPAGSL